jgi:hypothetical protein
MRLHLYRRQHMRAYVAWLYSCIILHNLLAGLGDQWAELEDDESLPYDDDTDEEDIEESAEDFRDRLTINCVCYNMYHRGILH